MTNDIDTDTFKKRLEEERDNLLAELKTVGRVNPDNPNDWEPTPDANAEHDADENTEADNKEEYEEHTAILKDLETRYQHVLRALKKIDEGTYGICEVSGEPIEKERLEANPAARTCQKHMNEND